jgi:hypothetical protein
MCPPVHGQSRGHWHAVCKKKSMPNKDKQADKRQGKAQTNLAEGERDTVDESIRIHEKKGDSQNKPTSKNAKKK